MIRIDLNTVEQTIHDGLVLMHNIDKGRTIDYNYYIENCLRSFVSIIWKQQVQNCLIITVILKLFNVTIYAIEEGISIMLYLPYSSVLTLCNLWPRNSIERSVVDFTNEI